MTTAILVLGNITQADAFLGFGEQKKEGLAEAIELYQNREYYKARKVVEKYLDKNPQSAEATQLMATILDKEIERQREHLISQDFNGMSSDERKEQVRTWLERSRALLRTKQYDFALFAAEKVFLYDHTNSAASDLIDDIKAAALKDGRDDSLFIHKIYEEEISDRVVRYRDEAADLAARGKFGQAKFVAEKVLMLEPEDPTSLSVLQRILSHQEKTRSERR